MSWHTSKFVAAFIMDDEIVSIPLLDQGLPMRTLVNACLVVDGWLQPEILRESFKELVKLWPKLGARLVRNKQVRSLHSQRME